MKYIEDSIESGYFLNASFCWPLLCVVSIVNFNFLLQEELYEWGNPKSVDKVPLMNTSLKSVAKAAHRWRTKIESKNSNDSNSRAFCDFRVILHCSKPDPIRNLLEAGGGCVLNIQ